MTISHVQGTSSAGSAGSATSIAATFGSAVTSGNGVVVVFGYGTSGGDLSTAPTITDDKGNSYTYVERDSQPGAYGQGVAYLLDITNRPSTITVTFPEGHAFPSIIIDEYSGIGSFDQHAVTAGGSGGPTFSAPSITTTAADLVHCYCWVNSGTLSPGSTFTQTGAPFTNVTAEYLVQGSAGSITATMTGNSAQSYVIGVVAFTPSGGGGAISATVLMPIENLAGQRIDNAGQIESLTGIVPPPLWIEWTAASSALVSRDSLLAIEVLGTASIGRIRLEWLAALPPSGGAIPLSPSPFQIEFSAAMRRDVLLADEWQGTTGGSVVADSATYLELLLRQAGDATLTAEAIARGMREAFLSLEDLSRGLPGVGSDGPMSIEVSVPVRTDAGLPSAWATSVSFAAADTPLLFEIVGETPSPAPAIPQVSGRRLRLFRV